MIEQIVVPDVGEGVESGKVVAVHLKVGAQVEIDDAVVELETDKAVVEIPSTVAGTVVEVLAREGEDLKVGAVIAKVETAATAVAAEDNTLGMARARQSILASHLMALLQTAGDAVANGFAEHFGAQRACNANDVTHVHVQQ